MKPYSSLAIANEFIIIGADKSATDMSPMKLQKLVYLSHGWHLAFHSQPLIDERIEAWDFGPVVPDLYNQLREFGNESVGRPVETLRRATADSNDGPVFNLVTPRVDPLNNRATHVIHEVWRVYGTYTPTQLSNLTHQPETPWSQTIEPFNSMGYIPRGLDISDELIERCFKRYLAN